MITATKTGKIKNNQLEIDLLKKEFGLKKHYLETRILA
jgi:hypothetical protein